MSEVRNPNPEQFEVMKKYASMVEELVAMITSYENNFAGTNAISRAHESMMWFHSFILNGAKLLPKQEVKEGELQTAKPEETIN